MISIKIIIVLAILPMIMIPGFAQIVDPIQLTTDKSSYGNGETVTILGSVSQVFSGYQVSLSVYVKNGNMVQTAKVTPNGSATFVYEMELDDDFKASGYYTIKALYVSQARTDITTFYYDKFDYMSSGGLDVHPVGKTVNKIPEWVRETFKFWADGLVSDQELLDSIRFLVDNRIIIID